jgi:hypothetical protein
MTSVFKKRRREGHGFSRAVEDYPIRAALAAEVMTPGRTQPHF